MSLTRATIEAAILGTAGGKMSALGNRPDGVTPWMDSTTKDGTNADLAAPIAYAVLMLGGSLADPNAVTDADVAPFAGIRQARLIDFATVQTLYNVLGNMQAVDWDTGRNSQKDSQLADQVNELIKVLSNRIEKPLGRQVPGTAVARPNTGGTSYPNDPFRWPCGRSRPGRWPYP